MTDIETMLDEFGQRAGALGVPMDRVPDSPAAATAIQREATDASVIRLVASREVRRWAPGLIRAVEDLLDVETATDPAAVRDAPLALTLAHAAYAETGSVLLAEPDLADRAVGMLSGTLSVVPPTTALRAGLDDPVAELRAIASRPGGGYATVMTGPSRTADIERVLTVGVQGPGRVVVVFVDDLTWAECESRTCPRGHLRTGQSLALSDLRPGTEAARLIENGRTAQSRQAPEEL